MGSPRLPVPGNRVRIKTFAGGCYDGLTGLVIRLDDDNFQSLPPEQYPDARWWRVALDKPACNGGVPVFSDVFLPSELETI